MSVHQLVYRWATPGIDDKGEAKVDLISQPDGLDLTQV
jgi:hypothetical protein